MDPKAGIFATVTASSLPYVSGRQNVLQHGNILYSTLADVPLSGKAYNSQPYELYLPPGWTLVERSSELIDLLTRHGWSTDIIVFSNGYGYSTNNSDTPGQYRR